MNIAGRGAVVVGALVWALAAGSALATDRSAPRDPRAGGSLVIGAMGGIAALNPLITRVTVAANLFDVLYVRLLEETDDGQVAPGLARSWRGSEDYRTWEFELRDDVVFADGVPVTAGDVVLTLQLLEQERGADWPLPPMEELTAVTPHLVRIRFAEAPDPSFLFRLREHILPQHVIGPELEQGRSVEELSIGRKPVGSGPFRFAGWRNRGEVVLTANDSYPGGGSLLDSVVVRAGFKDTEEMWVALMRGEVDIASHATPADLSSIQLDPQVAVLPMVSPYYWSITWNCRASSVLSDPRLRQAVSWAIDRRAIWERMGGLAGVPDSVWQVCGPLAPGSVWADPDIAPQPFDPGKAVALLEGSQWAVGGPDGVRAKAGRRLELTVLIQREFPYLEDVAALLRRDLEQVGVRLAVKSLSYAELSSRESLDSEPWDLLWGGGRFDLDPAACVARWHSNSPANTGGYAVAAMDSLIESGGRERDPQFRRELYWRAHRQLVEDMPTTFVCRHASAIVLRRGIGNGQVAGRRGLFRSLPVLYWDRQAGVIERRVP